MSTSAAPVVVYRRTIRASVARIWENVLDWEHLPWLHAASFAAIALTAEDADGWRAWVTLAGGEPARRALIDVRLARSELRYWTRTLEGTGVGSALRTTLSPAGPRATAIVVEPFVPGLPAAYAARAGAAFVQLYTRLWDEDEAMMVRRTAHLAPAAHVPDAAVALGRLDELRAQLPLVVGAGARRVRLLDLDGTVAAFSIVCPHRGGPLETAEVRDGIVTCPWHGYRFDVRTGASTDGRRLCLARAPRLEVDAADEVTLRW